MARWQWMAVGLLASVELGIAGLMLAPQVTADYRAYFIERRSDCWPRSVSGDYRMGESVSFLDDAEGKAADRHKVCGWVPPFAAGSWSRGDRAELLFTMPVPPQGVVIDLLAEAFVDAAHRQQRVEVRVNGARLDDLVYSPDSQGLRRVMVPAEVAVLRASVLHLRLDFPDRYSPREMGLSDDTRELGILLKAVTISPLPE